MWQRGAWTRWEQNLMGAIVSHILLGKGGEATSSCQNHLLWLPGNRTRLGAQRRPGKATEVPTEGPIWSSTQHPPSRLFPLEPTGGPNERNGVRYAELLEEFQQRCPSEVSLCRAYNMLGISEGPTGRGFQEDNRCVGLALTQQITTIQQTAPAAVFSQPPELLVKVVR